MSERDAVAVHGALGAAQLEVAALQVEVADCKALAVAVIERLTTERDGLLATIEQVKALADEWVENAVEQRKGLEAMPVTPTSPRVRALALADAAQDDADQLRAALESSS